MVLCFILRVFIFIRKVFCFICRHSDGFFFIPSAFILNLPFCMGQRTDATRLLRRMLYLILGYRGFSRGRGLRTCNLQVCTGVRLGPRSSLCLVSPNHPFTFLNRDSAHSSFLVNPHMTGLRAPVLCEALDAKPPSVKSCKP